MKRERKETFSITLTLDEREADWLKELVQNPHREDEPDDEYEIRRRFWEALS